MYRRIISFITMLSLLSLVISRHVQPVQTRHHGSRVGPVSRREDSKAVINHHLRLTKTPASTISMLPYESKVLSCQAVGSPPPTIHWLKDGERLIQDTLASLQDDGNIDTLPLYGASQTRSKLFVDCITARDEGTYTCVAETPYSRASSDTMITVSEEELAVAEPLCLKNKLFGLPPRIYTWTRFRIELQGNDVQLFCRSSGLPKPRVTWSRSGKETPLKNGEKYIILDNGDLIIQNIIWEDMGIYTCNAQNAFGLDTALAFLYPAKPNKK
ncbi:zwei Ig domain protein zig-2-like [Limulus polyphemus]|uniref:Zwei Ig domain protein zig-2-like n=1 Tax=Limulus polyphemus TaxID=6850 RepID=A0ABM1BKP6_LIMPO|nr:zwei Ig domain protein zig-2-like [Limulus polyphemus]